MTEIRKATVLDIPQIQRIAQITWPMTFKDILSPSQLNYMMKLMYSSEELTSQIEGGKIIFWMAMLENTISGFMAYESQQTIPSQIKIHKLYVLPTAHGNGIGKNLLKNLEEYGKVKGFKELTLNVNKYNLSAISFYKKRGFKKVDEEIIPIGQGYIMDDFVFKKDLKKQFKNRGFK